MCADVKQDLALNAGRQCGPVGLSVVLSALGQDPYSRAFIRATDPLHQIHRDGVLTHILFVKYVVSVLVFNPRIYADLCAVPDQRASPRTNEACAVNALVRYSGGTSESVHFSRLSNPSCGSFLPLVSHVFIARIEHVFNKYIRVLDAAVLVHVRREVRKRVPQTDQRRELLYRALTRLADVKASVHIQRPRAQRLGFGHMRDGVHDFFFLSNHPPRLWGGRESIEIEL